MCEVCVSCACVRCVGASLLLCVTQLNMRVRGYVRVGRLHILRITQSLLLCVRLTFSLGFSDGLVAVLP